MVEGLMTPPDCVEIGVQMFLEASASAARVKEEAARPMMTRRATREKTRIPFNIFCLEEEFFFLFFDDF